MLHHIDLDISYLFPGIITNHNISTNFLSMVINILIEGNFQVDFTAGESESLGHQGAGKAASTLDDRSKLQFFDCQLDGATFVAFVFFVGANVAFYVVFYTKGFTLVILACNFKQMVLF